MAELPSTTKRPFADHKESDSAHGGTKRCRLESFAPVQPEPLPPLRLPSFLDPVEQASPAHPYCTDSVATFVTQWLESDSYRQRHCRSETSLNRFDRDIIPRRLTKSVPGMADRKDRQGFVMPPTPDSRSQRAESDTKSQVSFHPPPSVAPGSSISSSSRSKPLVELPEYRDENLAANHIFFSDALQPYPEHISSLLDNVRRDRSSPGPSPDEVRENMWLQDLAKNGAEETEVERYFHTNIFPNPTSRDVLMRRDRTQMFRNNIPTSESKLTVSAPVPDTLYGYSRHAFSQQGIQLASLGSTMKANASGLLCPFFVIEFKGDGGSMLVATNQCLGAAASCVNIAERLKSQLKDSKSAHVREIDSAAFSIAMNGTDARLHVSWKQDELNYYMRTVETFSLQRADNYREFRKYVRNIVDWGIDRRLKAIQKSMDAYLDEIRNAASEQAKSRPPPSATSSSSNKRLKHASSSSRGRGRPNKSVQNCDTDVDKAATE